MTGRIRQELGFQRGVGVQVEGPVAHYLSALVHAGQMQFVLQANPHHGAVAAAVHLKTKLVVQNGSAQQPAIAPLVGSARRSGRGQPATRDDQSQQGQCHWQEQRAPGRFFFSSHDPSDRYHPPATQKRG